jgi:hypothetical protein
MLPPAQRQNLPVGVLIRRILPQWHTGCFTETDRRQHPASSPNTMKNRAFFKVVRLVM